MPSEPISARTGLWNGSNELFKGLRFESKDDLKYAVNCNLIFHNQHLVVCESQPHLWVVRCKKWNKDVIGGFVRVVVRAMDCLR